MRARSLLLLALAAALAPACRRLNPEWCATGTRCAAGEICDPATNTCLRREAGAPEARPKDTAREPLLDSPPPPDQRPPDRVPLDAPSSCSGGWICAGGAAHLCTEAAPIKRRNCPGQKCVSGHCEFPGSASGCKRDEDCKTGTLCTLLLDKGAPKLLCAEPVSGAALPVPCQSGLDCASGLCTSSGRCYHACDAGSDCPPTNTCKAVTVVVEGVSTLEKSCEPF